MPMIVDYDRFEVRPEYELLASLSEAPAPVCLLAWDLGLSEAAILECARSLRRDGHRVLRRLGTYCGRQVETLRLLDGGRRANAVAEEYMERVYPQVEEAHP